MSDTMTMRADGVPVTVRHGYLAATHKRFIVNGPGLWAAGDTITEAVRNYRKIGGRTKDKLFLSVFLSGNPFLPFGSRIPDQESEHPRCYVDDAGSVCWKHCLQIDLGEM